MLLSLSMLTSLDDHSEFSGVLSTFSLLHAYPLSWTVGTATSCKRLEQPVLLGAPLHIALLLQEVSLRRCTLSCIFKKYIQERVP